MFEKKRAVWVRKGLVDVLVDDRGNVLAVRPATYPYYMRRGRR